jgi:hypothetical protein
MKCSHLRTETKEEFHQACVDADLVDSDGEIITATHDHFLHLVGDLYKPTGAMLDDGAGGEYPEKIKLSGYHVNMKAKIETGLEHLAIEVGKPLIKIAGE